MTTPTPLARACARIAAVLALCLPLASPAPAKPQQSAPVTWVKLTYTYQNTTYVFYHPKGARPYTDHEGHPRLTLYRHAVESASEQARSHLFLLVPERKYRLHLVAEEGSPVDLVAGAVDYQHEEVTPGASPAPTGSAPAGVDPATWAEVRSKYPALSLEDAALLARSLSELDRSHPDQKAAVRAWLAADPANPTKAVQAARGAGPAAAAGQLSAWAAAPTGAAPAPNGQQGGGVTPTPTGQVPETGPGQQVGSDEPIKPLIKAMKAPGQGDDVAKRIVDWLWQAPAGARSFIDPDTFKNHADEKGIILAELKKAIASDGKDSLKTAAFWVYYALGAGSSAPQWISSDPDASKLMLEGRDRFKTIPERLAQCLDRYRYDPNNAPVEDCNKAPLPAAGVRGPFVKKPEWVGAFLKDAGVEASKLIGQLLHPSNPGTTIGGAPGSGPEVPGGGIGGRRPGIPSAASGVYDVSQLFGKWGDPNVFYLDGRLVALVLRTQQTVTPGDPPKVTLSQQLGLYDISNESEIYGRRFDFTKSGEQSFSLKPGGKQYKVTLSPNGSDTDISITNPKGDKIQLGNGKDKLPSLSTLFQMRAQQALDSGNRVVIDGKAYRVTGESTSTGNLIFWDEAMLEKARSTIAGGFAGSVARDWVPSMMASVNKMQDGRPTNVGPTVSLGVKGANGKWQGLRWNDGTGAWEPAEGDAYAPTPTTTPATPGAPGASTSTVVGGTGPGTAPTAPGGTGTTDADGWPRLQKYDASVPRAADLNGKLSATAKNHVRFYAIPNDQPVTGAGQRVLALLDKTPPDQGKLFNPPYLGLNIPHTPVAAPGTDSENVISDGQILVAKTDQGQSYVDLEKVTANSGNIETGALGSYVKGGHGNTVDKVTDLRVLVPILGAAGYPADAAEKVKANLRQALDKEHATAWSLSGFQHGESDNSLSALVGTSSYCVYPTFKPCTQADRSPGSVPKPGNGFALEPAGTTQLEGSMPFAETTGLQTGEALTRVDPKPVDAALYVNEKDGKKRWYLSYIVTATDNGGVHRAKTAPVFAFDEEGARIKKPEHLDIGGVTLAGRMPDQVKTKVVALDAPLEKEGFIGAYRGDSPDSCLGVVAWWGTQRQKACDRCGGRWANGTCTPVH